MNYKIGRLRLIVPLLTLFFICITTTNASADQSGRQISEQVTGDLAYAHVVFLSEEIGARVTGTFQEMATADYIIEQFESMGYDVEIQPFTFERNSTTYFSENIIATKHGKLDQAVIIGAHYDSVSERVCEDIGQVSTGAGDNASGVGVMLEVAEILTNYNALGTIKFVAFGAEEMGLQGSRYYAEQMTDDEITNTVAMIDLDSVGVGDFFYVYAGLDNNPGWARDLALRIGQSMGHDLRTSPQSEYFEWGTTGDWSDHVPFRLLGIPIAYFEWMNWDIEPDGGIETEEYGWVMHTCRDNLSLINHDKLENTAEVVSALVFELSKPNADKGKGAKGNKYIRIQKRTDLPN